MRFFVRTAQPRRSRGLRFGDAISRPAKRRGGNERDGFDAAGYGK
jgi:hypothetical protein